MTDVRVMSRHRRRERVAENRPDASFCSAGGKRNTPGENVSARTGRPESNSHCSVLLLGDHKQPSAAALCSVDISSHRHPTQHTQTREEVKRRVNSRHHAIKMELNSLFYFLILRIKIVCSTFSTKYRVGLATPRW